MKLKFLIILLIIPLLTVSILVVGLNPLKDPAEVIGEAYLKMSGIDDFLLESEVTIVMEYLGTTFEQLATTIIAFKEGKSYVSSQADDSMIGYSLVSESFSFNNQSFNCLTNDFINGTVCVEGDSTSIDPLQFSHDFMLMANQSMISTTFKGLRVIGGRSCNLISAAINQEFAAYMGVDLYETDVDSAFNSEICFDTATGLPIYYSWGSTEPDNKMSFSQTLKQLSFDVPDELFNLPSEPITQEAFDLLYNGSIV